MMRVPGRSRSALLLTLPLLALSGCKSAPSPPAAQAAQPQERSAAFYSRMTDEALVRLDVQHGLGLGLKMPADSFRSGSQMTFHAVLEDVGATEPIASGLCSGFVLAYQNTADGNTGSAQIDNRACFAAMPPPDEVPLTRDKLKTVDFTQREASNLVLPPGHYLIHLSWTAYAPGKLTLAARIPYATLQSNEIPITIDP